MKINIDLKSNFIEDYGSYAEPFDKLDYLGNMKTREVIILILCVVLAILSIVTYSYSQPDIDPQTKKELERTTYKKFLRGLMWLLIILTIIGFGYSGYSYLFLYLPQYYEWFKSLPKEAKTKIGMIKAIDSVKSASRNARRNSGLTISL